MIFPRPYEYGLDGYYFTIDELNTYWSSINGFSGQPQKETYDVAGLSVEHLKYGKMIEHYKVNGETISG